MRHLGLIGALAIATASIGDLPRKKRKLRLYTSFCGPPYPASRQHLRAMLREAAKPLPRKDRSVPLTPPTPTAHTEESVEVTQADRDLATVIEKRVLKTLADNGINATVRSNGLPELLARHRIAAEQARPTSNGDGVREAAAKAIFEHYAFGRWEHGEKPAWVERGNSDMQTLARQFASAALCASPAPDSTAGQSFTPGPETPHAD